MSLGLKNLTDKIIASLFFIILTTEQLFCFSSTFPHTMDVECTAVNTETPISTPRNDLFKNYNIIMFLQHPRLSVLNISFVSIIPSEHTNPCRMSYCGERNWVGGERKACENVDLFIEKPKKMQSGGQNTHELSAWHAFWVVKNRTNGGERVKWCRSDNTVNDFANHVYRKARNEPAFPAFRSRCDFWLACE